MGIPLKGYVVHFGFAYYDVVTRAVTSVTSATLGTSGEGRGEEGKGGGEGET